MYGIYGLCIYVLLLYYIIYVYIHFPLYYIYMYVYVYTYSYWNCIYNTTVCVFYYVVLYMSLDILYLHTGRRYVTHINDMSGYVYVYTCIVYTYYVITYTCNVLHLYTTPLYMYMYSFIYICITGVIITPIRLSLPSGYISVIV